MGVRLLPGGSYRGGETDGEQASRADGWKIAASRKVKKMECKKEKDRLQPPKGHGRDFLMQIEQRSTQIEKELHDILEKEGKIRVVDFRENSVQVEVDERFIGVVRKEEQQPMTMTFQVAGVKKALAAVLKICKAGNIVQFGDETADGFIWNKASK